MYSLYGCEILQYMDGIYSDPQTDQSNVIDNSEAQDHVPAR